MFPERIKELRLKKRYTQKQIADKIGITRPAYTAYESGKRQPDFEILKKLSKIFGVTTDYLLGNEKNHNADIPKDKLKTKPETIAAHIDDDVSEDEMEDIINYIDFIKQKHSKRKE